MNAANELASFRLVARQFDSGCRHDNKLSRYVENNWLIKYSNKQINSNKCANNNKKFAFRSLT